MIVFAFRLYINMEKNQTIEQLLDQTESNSIQKIRKSPLQGIIIILVAIALIILNEKLSFITSVGIIPPFIIMAAFGLITWGVLSVFIRDTTFVDKNTHKKVSFRDVFFDKRDYEKLILLLDAGRFEEISTVKRSTQDGVKLRIATTPDFSVCYVQVLTFISYHYALTNQAKKITEEQAKVLFEAIA